MASSDMEGHQKEKPHHNHLHQRAPKRFEVNERMFLDGMKTLVIKQLQQMTEIAKIQDQVVAMIQAHQQRKEWLKSRGLKRYLSPQFFTLHKETMSVLCLVVFLLLELLIQLLFSGHFRHLAPHLPEFLQARLLK